MQPLEVVKGKEIGFLLERKTRKHRIVHKLILD